MQTDAIINVRFGDSDADTYKYEPMDKLLARWNMENKDNNMEMTQLISVQYLCELIPNHVQSGTKLHRLFLFCDPIRFEIIPDVDLMIPLDT